MTPPRPGTLWKPAARWLLDLAIAPSQVEEPTLEMVRCLVQAGLIGYVPIGPIFPRSELEEMFSAIPPPASSLDKAIDNVQIFSRLKRSPNDNKPCDRWHITDAGWRFLQDEFQLSPLPYDPGGSGGYP